MTDPKTTPPAGSDQPWLREHRLVDLLDRCFSDSRHKGLLSHPRIDNLPAMLLRHGLLQVTLFLRQKELAGRKEQAGTFDGQLLKLLGETMAVLYGRPPDLSPGALAGAGKHPGHYLLLNELAIQSATWIRKMAAAHREVEQVSNDTATVSVFDQP